MSRKSNLYLRDEETSEDFILISSFLQSDHYIPTEVPSVPITIEHLTTDSKVSVFKDPYKSLWFKSVLTVDSIYNIYLEAILIKEIKSLKNTKLVLNSLMARYFYLVLGIVL